jgi:hypothetical protein
MDFGIFTMVPTLVPVSPFVLSAPSTGPSVQLREVGTLSSRDCKSWSIHWLQLIWALSSWHIFMHAHLTPDACIRSVRRKIEIESNDSELQNPFQHIQIHTGCGRSALTAPLLLSTLEGTKSSSWITLPCR